MKKVYHSFGILFVAFVLCVPAFAQSQSTTGLIQGTVSDPNGAVVSGASVTVKNVGTGFERTVSTNSDGFFSAPLLPLGKYQVVTEAKGFGKSVVEGIELTIGQTRSLDIGLKIGGAVDTVNVTAEGEGVETARTELSSQIDSKSVENLPIGRRDFSRFALLTPGVSVVQGPDGDEITINGQKGIQNNLSIDGADANNPFFGEQRGGQRPAFTISLESVKEFQVVPVGASAEFGRSSGGFINVVTKSGSNDVAGSAFLFFRNQRLSGQNPDAVAAKLPTESFHNYQFGANVGGPIQKDKAFFFLAYERNDGKSSKPNSINPILVNLFATRFGSPGEQGIIERTNIADVLLGKVDFQINNNNLLTLRHNYSRAVQVNGTFDVPTWGTSANGRETDNSNSFIGQLVSNFSSNLLNEFRFQFAREGRPRFYDGPNLPDVAIGTFDGSISYRFGRPFFLPVPEIDTRFQFTDNLTVLSGNHSIKIGADINRVKTSQTFIGFARGRYIFAGGTIGQAIQGFQNYINGVDVSGLALYLQFVPLNGRTVEQAGTQEFAQFEPGVYVQDNWQVRQDLTLNLGFRWEGQFQPDTITPPAKTLYSPLLNDPRFGSNGTIPDGKDGYQPRLGLSWSPGKEGKTAIRLGAGLYFARIPGLVLAGPRNTDGVIAANLYRDGSFCQFVVPACPVFPGVLSTAGFSPFFTTVAVFEKNFKNPRTIQYSVSVERELVKDLNFTIAYNYAHSTRLTRFINRADNRLGGPFLGGLIGEVRSTESSGKSLYQGVNFNLNKRFTNKFQFQLNYLLSVDKSDDDNERDPFTYRYADPRDLRSEYNFSDRDQRHRFNAFATFALPYDFTISPILQYRSASPTSVPNRTTATLRNTLRLDNQFFTFDVRASKTFKLTEKMSIEGIFEAFNLTNSRNLKRTPSPLTFNFDGTVSAGFGEPRQAQLGVKFKF